MLNKEKSQRVLDLGAIILLMGTGVLHDEIPAWIKEKKTLVCINSESLYVEIIH